MSTSFQSFQHCLPGPFGKALLRELWTKHWDTGGHHRIEILAAALGSTTGKRVRNEDRLALAQVASANGMSFWIAIVCDGVGGSEKGDAAATIAVASVLNSFATASTRAPLALLLTEAVCTADDNVRSSLGGRGATTLSVVVLSSSGDLAATNVGDSRLYSWIPGGGSVKQVSIDDTLENELQKLAIRDPRALAAHGLRGRLSQAIGEDGRDAQDLIVKLFTREQFPQGVILASDGAWKSDQLGFELIAKEAKGASDAVRKALAFADWTGNVDNTSLIAIENLHALAGDQPHQAEFQQISLWLADQKVVLNAVFDASRSGEGGFPQVSQARRKVNAPSDGGAFSDQAKPKRRTSLKRKAVAKPHPFEPELDLQVSQHDASRENEKARSRPQLEISVDDEEGKGTS